MASRVADLALRYPVQTLFTALTLLAIGATLAFVTVGLPLVTRSLRNFIRLGTLAFVLLLFTVAFWLPPAFERLERRKT